jgi:hypothetical protein
MTFKRSFWLLLAFVPSVAWSLSLADLETNIRRNVRDVSSTQQRYSDTIIDALINEAQRAVINDTWAVNSYTSITLVSGSTYYTLPATTIKVWRVTLDGANLPELDLKQLDADSGNGVWSSTGTATAYFLDPSSTTVIGLQPYPNSSGGALKVFFHKLPVDLSSDSDIPFDGDIRLYAYHDLLVYHVSFRLLVIEDKLQEAQAYQALYGAGIQTMALNVGRKPLREIAPSKEIRP